MANKSKRTIPIPKIFLQVKFKKTPKNLIGTGILLQHIDTKLIESMVSKEHLNRKDYVVDVPVVEGNYQIEYRYWLGKDGMKSLYDIYALSVFNKGRVDFGKYLECNSRMISEVIRVNLN